MFWISLISQFQENTWFCFPKAKGWSTPVTLIVQCTVSSFKTSLLFSIHLTSFTPSGCVYVDFYPMRFCCTLPSSLAGSRIPKLLWIIPGKNCCFLTKLFNKDTLNSCCRRLLFYVMAKGWTLFLWFKVERTISGLTLQEMDLAADRGFFWVVVCLFFCFQIL